MLYLCDFLSYNKLSVHLCTEWQSDYDESREIIWSITLQDESIEGIQLSDLTSIGQIHRINY